MKAICLLFLITLLHNTKSEKEERCLDESITTDDKICKITVYSKEEPTETNIYKLCPSGYSCAELLSSSPNQKVYGCELLYKKKEEGSSCDLGA